MITTNPVTSLILLWTNPHISRIEFLADVSNSIQRPVNQRVWDRRQVKIFGLECGYQGDSSVYI